MGRRHKLPGAKNGSGVLNHGRNATVYSVWGLVALVVLGVALGGGGDTGPSNGAGVATESTQGVGTATSAATATATQTATEQAATYSVKIIYDGEWSGAVGVAGSTRSVDGVGTTVIEINEAEPSVISANAQKRSGSGTLTIQVLKGSEVVAETSTSAEYGVASVSYSVPLFDLDGTQAVAAEN